MFSLNGLVLAIFLVATLICGGWSLLKLNESTDTQETALATLRAIQSVAGFLLTYLLIGAGYGATLVIH